MNPNFIIFTIIPFLLMAISIFAFPIYRIKLMNTAGEKLVPLTKKYPWLSYVTSAVAVILTLLAVKFDFGKLNFVVPYCAVLGLIVATRESTFLPVNGVYENLMVVGSEILKYEDIISFAAESESSQPDYVLVIKTKNRGTRQFIFNNSNEAAEARKVIENRVNVQ